MIKIITCQLRSSMIKYLIQKEFLQIRRNAFLPKLIFVFPIVIMCVMPWVMNQEVKNIRVSVVDNDRSSLSRQLVQSIGHNRSFVLTGQLSSYDAALKEVEKSRTDIVLVIPQDFGKNEMTSGGGEVLIAANAVNAERLLSFAAEFAFCAFCGSASSTTSSSSTSMSSAKSSSVC